MSDQQKAMLDLLTEAAEARVQELVEPLERFRYEMFESVDAAIADALGRILARSFRGHAGTPPTDGRNGQDHAAAAHSHAG